MGRNETVAELLELEDQRCRAIASVDIAALDRLLAEEYTYTHVNGNTDDKPTYLKGLKPHAHTMTGRDLRVRTYGDAAVITGTLVFTFALEGEAEPGVAEVKTQQVWIRDTESWKQVATAQSGVLPSK